MTFDMQAARELCEKASFHLTGNEIDEDLKILVDQAAMLPAALDRIEELQADNIRKDGLIGRLMAEGNDMPKTIDRLTKRIAELEGDLSDYKKVARDLDRDLVKKAMLADKQHAALKKLGQAKRARDKALIEERARRTSLVNFSPETRSTNEYRTQPDRMKDVAREQLRQEGLI